MSVIRHRNSMSFRNIIFEKKLFFKIYDSLIICFNLQKTLSPKLSTTYFFSKQFHLFFYFVWGWAMSVIYVSFKRNLHVNYESNFYNKFQLFT